MALNFGKYLSFLKVGSDHSSPDEVVGVDVGSAAIKVVQLKRTERAITLVTYGEMQIGPYANKSLGETAELGPEKQTEALVDVIRESSVTSQHGVLAIPDADSFLTVVGISAPSEADVASRINVEARKYIPVPLKEVTLNWFPIETVSQSNGIEQLVLLAAVTNDALAEQQALLKSVNLAGSPSEIEVFSTARAVLTAADTKTAVIDFGATATRIYIVEDTTVRRMYSSVIGGEHFTKQIVAGTELDFAAAEIEKRTFGLQPDGSIKALIEPDLLRLLRELTLLIKKYENNDSRTVDNIVITGGGAAMHELVPLLETTFGKPVRIADPFAKVAYPAFMEDLLLKAGPSFSVALGAALRSLE